MDRYVPKRFVRLRFLVRLVYNSSMRTYHPIKYKLKYGDTNLFNDINIETTTACNKRCSYCPNSVFDRGLLANERLMDEDLFKKIIDELAEINFDGRISPHSYGESLLDKRLGSLMTYTRKKLPKARLEIFTSGDLLTPDLYKRLIDAGVDRFYVSQHGETMSKNMVLLYQFLKENPDKKKVVTYGVVTPETPLCNRGGLVNPATINLEPRCSSPSNPVVIDYKGDVVLCCNDYLGSVIFGNVEDKSLVEIWKSEKYKLIRNQLRKRIYQLDLCKKCTGAIV